MTDAQNANLTASAYALLSAVDARLTTPAKASWRWRILLLRAQVDSIRATGISSSPTLCRDYAELTAIQHVEGSSCCKPHSCATPPPSPPPGPPKCAACAIGTPAACRPCTERAAPAAAECPTKAWGGSFVPWVRAVNQSNVFGLVEGAHNVGLPLLGVFDTEAGCRSACEARANCTQYNWCGVTGGGGGSVWDKHCYGRCDDVWRVSFVPHMSPAGTMGGEGGEDCPVAARRVKPERSHIAH